MDRSDVVPNSLQNTAKHRTHETSLQHPATPCNMLQHTATHCNTLHYTETHCNALNTLHYTATGLTRYQVRMLDSGKKILVRAWNLVPIDSNDPLFAESKVSCSAV